MQKNATWIGLIIFVLAMTGWFGSKAAVNLQRYYSLTARAAVDVEKWEIVGNGSDRYFLKAYYTSPFGKGEGVLGTLFRNPWAAEKAKEKLEGQTLQIWFNPKNPTKAVFQKNFPIKSVLSASVLLGLTIYFIGLGIYVSSRHPKR